MQKKNWLVLGLDEVDRLFQYPKNKMPNYQLPITNYQLPITNYQLPITNYQLPITNYQLPITHAPSRSNARAQFSSPVV
ncbi:MAG: hypothetical protein U7126_30800 [Microcoleus sp.]